MSINIKGSRSIRGSFSSSYTRTGPRYFERVYTREIALVNNIFHDIETFNLERYKLTKIGMSNL